MPIFGSPPATTGNLVVNSDLTIPTPYKIISSGGIDATDIDVSGIATLYKALIERRQVGLVSGAGAVQRVYDDTSTPVTFDYTAWYPTEYDFGGYVVPDTYTPGGALTVAARYAYTGVVGTGVSFYAGAKRGGVFVSGAMIVDRATGTLAATWGSATLSGVNPGDEIYVRGWMEDSTTAGTGELSGIEILSADTPIATDRIDWADYQP